MQIFAAITKVDEQTGRVYGRAVQEVVDRSGEIFDYATSKPRFAQWSEDFAKVTEGKSVGNVRAMHGKIAAGKLTEITFNDAEKAIDVCAEIVDPVEREKCLKGIYTGFSIGGRYEKKWADQDNQGVTRYTAQPSEISLVDLPCVPTAQFTVVKSDGSEELRKFETTMDDEALAKWVESLPDEQREALAKIADRKGVNPKDGEHKYGDVTFADSKNDKYPIDTPAHIRAAWNYINKPHNAGKYDSADLRTIKARIVSAWKKKIDPEGPPSARKEKPAEKAAHFDCVASLLVEKKAGEAIAKAAGELIGKPLEKGLFTVSCLAELLERLDCIACDTKFEEEIEADGSVIPAELRTAVTNLSEILVHMVAEEVEEMNAGHDVEVVELSAKGDLAKIQEDEAMNEELQKAHDETKAELAKVAGELATANETLAKVTGERDELQKGLDDIRAEVERIKALPAQPKGPLRAVEKGQDNDALSKDTPVDDKPVLKADGSVDHMATAQKAMKAALSKRA